MAAKYAGMQEAGVTSAELRLVRFALAVVWLATGFISLAVYPRQDSMALLGQVGLSGLPAEMALYGGTLLDIAFGLLTLFGRSRRLWVSQASLIVVYTFIITILLPEFWIHPFGPILKNLPILVLLWLLYKNEGRES